MIGLDSFNSKDHPDDWALSDSGKGSSNLEGPTHAPGATYEHQDRAHQPARHRAHLARGRRAVAARPRTGRSRSVIRTAAALARLVDACTSTPSATTPTCLYSVDSEIVAPPAATLQTVTMDELKAAPDYAKLTELPAHFPTSVGALAERLTEGAATPYDKALALENYFQSDLFTYDATPGLLQQPARARRLRAEDPPRVLRAVRRRVRRDGALQSGSRRVSQSATSRARSPPTACITCTRRTPTPGPRCGSGPNTAGRRSSRPRPSVIPLLASATPTRQPSPNNTSGSTTTTVTTTPSSGRTTPTTAVPSAGPFVNIDPKAGSRVSTGRRVAVGLGIGIGALLLALAGRRAVAGVGRAPAHATPPHEQRHALARPRRVDRSARTARGRRRDATTFGDVDRVRVAARARARCRGRGTTAHGSGATADVGVVRTRAAERRPMPTRPGDVSTRSKPRCATPSRVASAG